jgi:hypothetical protein
MACGAIAHLSYKSGCDPMPEKKYLVRFKTSDLSPQPVIAASVEIHGEHLVFLRSDGRLAALFVLEVVDNWVEAESRET